MKLTSIPVLMVTHNRLPYTVHALSCLLSEYAGVPTKITIFDNNSTDGTRIWLKYLNHPDIEEIILSPENVGLAKPMNEFFRKHKDAEFVCKVDNDTVLPEFWLTNLLASMRWYNLFPDRLADGETGAISGYALRPGGLTAKAWYDSMEEYHTHEGELRKNSYICGTGVLINMNMIREVGLLSESEPCVMGGWTSYCRIASDIVGGWNFYFDMSVFMRVLNLESDHTLSNDLPEYDKEMLKVRRDGNKWWSEQGGLKGVYEFIKNHGGFPRLEE